jgi:hypothetical protein
MYVFSLNVSCAKMVGVAFVRSLFAILRDRLALKTLLSWSIRFSSPYGQKRKQTGPGHPDWYPRHCHASINRLKEESADQAGLVGRRKGTALDECHERSEDTQGVQTDSMPEPKPWSGPVVESHRYRCAFVNVLKFRLIRSGN